MAVATQLIKDALPLVKKGGPGMIKTIFRDLFNSIAGNEGSSIAGNRVLITGGSNGIGRLMAEECARRGASAVIVWGYTPARIDAAVERLEQMKCKTKGYRVDVSDVDQVKAAAKEVLNDFGGVDILINSAGVVSGAPLLELSDSQIDRTLNINVRALFSVTREFLPGMLERNYGHIVTIASAAGTIGPAKMTDYAGSKWAARGFMESLRNELKKMGSDVKTLCVNPFYIDTGMFEGVKTKVPFLLPILKEEAVADKVIASIEGGAPELFMPIIVKFTALLRVLPAHWFDAAMNLLGINDTMNEFTGRG